MLVEGERECLVLFLSVAVSIVRWEFKNRLRDDIWWLMIARI